MEATEPKVLWNTENEDILIEFCDYAQCYKWMHSRSHQIYSIYNMGFTIPTIVLSTISGTASFALNGLPGKNTDRYASMAIGTINIFVGILSTVQQYLKITEKNEAHRIAAISWDKFARNIKIELAKAPPERTDAGLFFKHTRNEFDRYMETCPPISENVVALFLKEVGGKEGTEQRKKYDQLIKPDICNTIVSCHEHRYQAPASLANVGVAPALAPSPPNIKKFIKQFKNINEREPQQSEIEEYFAHSSDNSSDIDGINSGSENV
jgi:hypothetical protein